MNVFEITVQRRVDDLTPVVAEFNQGGGLPVRNVGRLERSEEVLNTLVTPWSSIQDQATVAIGFSKLQRLRRVRL